MAEHDDQLAALRREIDSVDTQLHDLLMQRTELAVKVGEVKARAQPIGRTPSEGAKFVRPAREAKILRRLITRHKGKLPKAVMVRMWREMISALLQVEGPFVVAVYTPPEEPGYWDIARDHYGCRVPILGFDRLNHAISAVLEGQATVAVLPLPHEGDRDPWWRRIAVKQPKVPHVIARLPFGDPGNQRGRGLQALVIGTTGFTPEQKADVVAASKKIPVCMSANYSIGVNVTLRLLELAAKTLGDDYDVEIVEAHHKHKIDAPSGTALTTAGRRSGCLLLRARQRPRRRSPGSTAGRSARPRCHGRGSAWPRRRRARSSPT